MSASWSSQSSANYLSYPAGDFAGNGAFTIALLVLPDIVSDCRLMDWFASSTEQGQFLIDTSTLFGADDFSSGYGTVAADAWHVLAMTKASGSQTYRCHIWAYASDGSGTMSHGVASGAGNHANFSTATTCRLGWSSGTSADGEIAVAAWWDSALSDGQLDTLKSSSLSAWSALTPDLGVHLGSWNGSTGDVVFAGSSATATLNGTVASGANPSGFTFSAAATKAPPRPHPARRLQPILAR